MRKKVDERIRILIENGVKTRHRSMFVIVGDKYHDQIVNLHYILGKAVVKSRPNVLWCYKNKLELSSHKKKRAKQLKRLMQSGLHDREKVDPLSLFLETAGLTYCMYRESERILGTTFGMCVLQDFEALTPNLLARSIETVEGGGLVILLIRTLASLTSLYTMVMDVHGRFRTESQKETTGRFNERFLLSLASCKACIVMDDELNILPISSHIKSIKPIPVKEDAEGLSEAEQDLKHVKEELNDDFPVGPLIKKCCTLDQGKAVITFLDAIFSKELKSTVACLAARGRGKSAALGLAVAGAVAAGYPSIYVTAPSPENLKTLFDFVCKGLEALDYKEHMDFDVVRSTEESKKSVVLINISKQSRQTIQYIQPQDHEKLSKVDLLVIDEAAAIPLPTVKALLGPYLVFLSSTVNGYEGTGRSLSLKLIQQLEQQSYMSAQSADGPQSGGRLFKKIELNESIRYASGDPIESWLNGLLCLDVTNAVPKLSGLPLPSECELYYVNRDTLFSYHKESELFLQRMMTLYVSSHYKNSPNDLQLMADAPGHQLFVLLGPVDESKNQIPDILCVIQASLEGKISRHSASIGLEGGRQPAGDQIPWKFNEQFLDAVFPSLSGLRIVRIATHPSAIKLGYGSQALELLTRYYEGKIVPFSGMDSENLVNAPPVGVVEAAKEVLLLEETIEPRKDLPHLLVRLSDRPLEEKLHYIGVSFGLTMELFRFWRNRNFFPFFISRTPSSITGEHACMILKPLNNDQTGDVSDKWGFLRSYFQDFRQRFIEELGDTFREMDYKLSMSITDPKINFTEQELGNSTLVTTIKGVFSTRDIVRLGGYTKLGLSYNSILYLVRKIARLYFEEKLPVTLSYLEVCFLLCKGLQGQKISQIQKQMGLGRDQILSLQKNAMKSFQRYLYSIWGDEIKSVPSCLSTIMDNPNVKNSMEEDLKLAARQVEEQMRPNTTGLDPELLQQHAIGADFDNALQNGSGKLPSGGLISVKSSRKDRKTGQKRDKSGDDGSKWSKKRNLGVKVNMMI